MARIKLDYDEHFPRDFWKRLRWIADTVPFKIRYVAEMRSTNGGYHIEIQTSRLPAIAVIMIQALMASDYRRETFNMIRVMKLGITPRFWRARLNVFYASKYRENGAMKIGKNDFRRGVPGIKVADISGKAGAVLTVVDAVETEFDGRKRLAVFTKEFGDEKAFYPNQTSIERLIEGLGDETDSWRGMQFAVEKTSSQMDGKPTVSLWVADPGVWKSKFKIKN